MRPRIRVLIVDDSVVIRRLVADALTTDPEIEVVGVAANGRIALQKIPQVNPDLVTLDIEMPELDGLATLVEIRKTWPALPVVMFSTATERGAAATIDALSRGASDYVTKPASAGGITQGLQRVRDELIPRIHALCPPPAIGPAPAYQPPPAVPRNTATAPIGAARSAGGIDVVAIGVSTGGPNALAALIPGLPRTLGVPVVITQHMPPMFTRMLAARLDSPTGLRVVEGEEGMLLEPGTAVIAPGDHHMVFVRKGTRLAVHLTQDPPENSCRPAVDVMLRSIVAHFGGATLGVILTGMGQDGLRGCELVRAAGGHVLVQDEASSVVWGMPGFVARAGLADAVLPLDHLAVEIARYVRTRARVPARIA
jgi:two-component system chemotaxis response regulator CheB